MNIITWQRSVYTINNLSRLYKYASLILVTKLIHAQVLFLYALKSSLALIR